MKTSRLNRIVALSLSTLMTASLLSLPASAITLPRDITGYASGVTDSARKRLQVFKNAELTVYDSSEYIQVNTDELDILEVNWALHSAKVRYPIDGGGFKSRWVHILGVLPAMDEDDVQEMRATRKITTYRGMSLGTRYGSISAGDTVYKFDTTQNKGKAVRVVYELDNGGWKLAFISENDLSKLSSTSSAAQSDANVKYFPKYSGSSGSIVNALTSLGYNASFAERTKIAHANEMPLYSGKASENRALLQLLRNGVLINPSDGTANPSTSGTSSSNSSVNPSANLSVSNRAKENGIKYANSPGQRSAEALVKVVDQYQVEDNSRYQRTKNATFCNVFCWDVTRALGAEIPHWIKDNAPATSNTSGARELNVNATFNWLKNFGSTSYGWTTVSSFEAQTRANAGYPTVAIWKNPTGQSGHIAIVMPEGNGYYYSSSRGPVISQAGAKNYDRCNVSTGFGSSRMSSIVYYTHA